MRRIILIFLFGISYTSYSQPEAKLQPYFTAIFVSNIDSAVQWYSHVFNLKVRDRYASEQVGYKQVNLHSNDMLIELIEMKSKLTQDEALKDKPKSTRLLGFSKFGFIVTQLDALHTTLSEKKVSFAGRTVADPATGKRMFLIQDPDGNYLQFFER